MKKFKITHSKSQCIIGIIFGIFFIILGIMLLIPSLGIFGLLATIIAIIFTNYYFYHLFINSPSDNVNTYSYTDNLNSYKTIDFDTKLRKLEKLKDDNLITEKEYKKKRKEIMKERW